MEIENETTETIETKETGTKETPETKETTNSDEKGNGEQQPAKSFTQEDIDAAVKKAKEETKAEMEKQAKLAKLPEDEQAKEKLKQDREQLDKDRAELDRRILIQKTEDMLSEKGLSRKFAKYFAGADEKETKKTVETFEKDFNEAVNAKVDVQLKGGKPPKAGGGDDPVDPFLAGLGL